MATLEQKIAQKEDELARLKAQSRKLENGQKIIIGGMMLSIARRDDRFAEMVLDNIKREIDKISDLNRLEPVMIELQALVDKAREDENRPM
jgi:hypothetical protein|tara:strand:+ start:1463 stop:1735 length:273 start_codon:yes stop_codon:yes gene_type:complete